MGLTFKLQPGTEYRPRLALDLRHVFGLREHEILPSTHVGQRRRPDRSPGRRGMREDHRNGRRMLIE